jgi:hypothetical protein
MRERFVVAIVALACLAFVGWAALPLLAELVGSWR